MMTRTLRIAATTLAALAAGAGSVYAQGAPPAPPTLPRDLPQPALIRPAAVSAPPSTVAPRLRAVRPTRADSAPVEPMKRVGLPVDSVRPVPAAATAADPARAPRIQAPPARPPAAAAVAAPEVTASRGPDVPPAGATARCKDGTYLFGALATEPCADRGGLAVRFPAPTPPPTPRRP